MHIRWPKPFAQWSIQFFANLYRINSEEAEKNISEYPSIGDFFIRKLRTDARPIAESPILHPADSVISQIGKIEDGQLIQAKGIFYPLTQLCRDEACFKHFNNGLFVTYYLCPTDYHRVHSPMDGEIVSVTHVPGTLWPVNNWSTQNIEAVFNLNERIAVDIKTAYGPIKLVFVGATNVGKISLSFDSNIISNNGSKIIRKVSYSTAIPVQKGDELGVFHMGSTVVMIYPPTIYKQRADWQEAYQGKAVKVRAGFL